MLKFNSVTEKFDMYWVSSGLPKEIVDIIEKEIKETFNVSEDTLDYGVVGDGVNLNTRKSKIQFISASTWIGAMCHYFVDIANKENFNYNINLFDSNQIQYTTYAEGEYYNWHTDSTKPDPNGITRKLSFIMQLSDPSEYEGGDVQILSSANNELFVLPKERGVISVFDSSLKHRVLKIKSGHRKSLVGWISGPRFI
jgi:PKHD-type hydroxylase